MALEFGITNPPSRAARQFRRSAGYEAGCIADFQIRVSFESSCAADLEIGDTTSSEAGASTEPDAPRTDAREGFLGLYFYSPGA